MLDAPTSNPNDEISEEPRSRREDFNAFRCKFVKEHISCESVFRRVVEECPVRPPFERLRSYFFEEEPSVRRQHTSHLRDRRMPLGNVVDHAKVKHRIE